MGSVSKRWAQHFCLGFFRVHKSNACPIHRSDDSCMLRVVQNAVFRLSLSQAACLHSCHTLSSQQDLLPVIKQKRLFPSLNYQICFPHSNFYSLFRLWLLISLPLPVFLQSALLPTEFAACLCWSAALESLDGSLSPATWMNHSSLLCIFCQCSKMPNCNDLLILLNSVVVLQGLQPR